MLNGSPFGCVWSRSQKLDVATGSGVPVLLGFHFCHRYPMKPLVGREMCLFFDIILQDKRDSIKKFVEPRNYKGREKKAHIILQPRGFSPCSIFEYISF